MKFDCSIRKSLYSQDECELIREKILESVDPNFIDYPAPNVIKTSEVKMCTYGNIKSELDKLHQYVLFANQNYFGLDLFEMSSNTSIMYNTYHEWNQGEYAWHKDTVENECFDQKLTALLNLSDTEYTGGQLELFLSGGALPIVDFDKPGTMIVFPSWICHKVTPVTQGTRKSLTIFYSGPNLK